MMMTNCNKARLIDTGALEMTEKNENAQLKGLPTVAFLFFFRADSPDSPDCLPILLNIIRCFTF